jgi:hypothetical protein
MNIKAYEIGLLLWLEIVLTYLNYAVEKSAIWNALYYVNMHGILEYSFIELYKTKKYNSYLMFTAIIFNGLYIAFNLSLIFGNYVTYYEYCTSDVFSLVFLIALIILLLTIVIYNKYGKCV